MSVSTPGVTRCSVRDARALELAPQRLGEGHHARLRRGVGGGRREEGVAGDAGVVHDLAGPALDHPRQHRLGEVHHRRRGSPGTSRRCRRAPAPRAGRRSPGRRCSRSGRSARPARRGRRTLSSIASREARSIFTGRTSLARTTGGSSNFSGERMPASSRPSGSRASASRIALPMPRLEPVTRAVRPVRSMSAQSVTA